MSAALRPLTAYVHAVKPVVEADPHGLSDDAVGVYVQAEVRFRTPQGGWTQGATIRTPGIWDVQGATPAYLAELEREERAELGDMLGALGLELPAEEAA